MKYQLMAIDMDGTLLNSHLEISKVNEEALIQAMQRGKIIVIASGRSLSEMNPYMDQLKTVRYFILESGAVIYDSYQDKIITKVVFSKEEVNKIIKASYKQDLMPHYFVNGYSYSFVEKMIHMDKYNMGKLQQFYLDHVNKIMEWNSFIEKNVDKIEKIIFYHQSNKEVEKCYQYLKDIDVEKPQIGISIELSPKGVTKASALKKLCHILNIEMNQTIAIGDSDNDLEILNEAGLAIAMNNANQNIKTICDIIVNDNDNDGVAQAIYTYYLDVFK